MRIIHRNDRNGIGNENMDFTKLSTLSYKDFYSPVFIKLSLWWRCIPKAARMQGEGERYKYSYNDNRPYNVKHGTVSKFTFTIDGSYFVNPAGQWKNT